MSTSQNVGAVQRPTARAIAAEVRVGLSKMELGALGLAVAAVTTIKGGLGVVLASSTLARGGAGMALAFGPICCGLLLPAQPDEK